MATGDKKSGTISPFCLQLMLVVNSKGQAHTHHNVFLCQLYKVGGLAKFEFWTWQNQYKVEEQTWKVPLNFHLGH